MNELLFCITFIILLLKKCEMDSQKIKIWDVQCNVLATRVAVGMSYIYEIFI